MVSGQVCFRQSENLNIVVSFVVQSKKSYSGTIDVCMTYVNMNGEQCVGIMYKQPDRGKTNNNNNNNSKSTEFGDGSISNKQYEKFPMK